MRKGWMFPYPIPPPYCKIKVPYCIGAGLQVKHAQYLPSGPIGTVTILVCRIDTVIPALPFLLS